jgi:hypothetical protein
LKQTTPLSQHSTAMPDRTLLAILLWCVQVIDTLAKVMRSRLAAQSFA